MATNSKPQETPEYRTFRYHYDRLVTAIQDPLPLATRLFARSIVDSTLLQRVNIPALPPFQNANTLLNTVLGKIQTDPSTFYVFMSALSEDPSMQSLVESMKSKCRQITFNSNSYFRLILPSSVELPPKKGMKLNCRANNLTMEMSKLSMGSLGPSRAYT